MFLGKLLINSIIYAHIVRALGFECVPQTLNLSPILSPCGGRQHQETPISLSFPLSCPQSLSFSLSLSLSFSHALDCAAGSARRDAWQAARVAGAVDSKRARRWLPVLKVRGFSLDLIYSYFFWDYLLILLMQEFAPVSTLIPFNIWCSCLQPIPFLWQLELITRIWLIDLRFLDHTTIDIKIRCLKLNFPFYHSLARLKLAQEFKWRYVAVGLTWWLKFILFQEL